MGWRPSSGKDAVLLELRTRGPGTTSEVAARLLCPAAWERGPDAPAVGYQAVYQRLYALEGALLVERPGFRDENTMYRGKNGALKWAATSRKRRKELVEESRSEALPADSDLELAEKLAGEHGIDIRLELCGKPQFTSYGPRWVGRIVLVTRRGEAALPVPVTVDGPCWEEGLRKAFDI